MYTLRTDIGEFDHCGYHRTFVFVFTVAASGADHSERHRVTADTLVTAIFSPSGHAIDMLSKLEDPPGLVVLQTWRQSHNQATQRAHEIINDTLLSFRRDQITRNVEEEKRKRQMETDHQKQLESLKSDMMKTFRGELEQKMNSMQKGTMKKLPNCSRTEANCSKR